MMWFFWAGETLNVGRLGNMGRRRVGHVVELIAQNDLARLEPDLRAHLAGHQLPVPGEALTPLERIASRASVMSVLMAVVLPPPLGASRPKIHPFGSFRSG